jgi:hypothetical protein
MLQKMLLGVFLEYETSLEIAEKQLPRTMIFSLSQKNNKRKAKNNNKNNK